MSSKVGLPGVLVVASDSAVRERLAACLAAHAEARPLAPEALGPGSARVDAAVALVQVGRDGWEREAEALRPLREPAHRPALVLLAPDLPEAALERLIERLDPDLLLPDDAPGAALRLAVRRLLPRDGPGRGARLQHRRATAVLGVSAAIRDVLEQVKQIAPTHMTVLLLGETGTGKELVARAIHERSARASSPFVAVNCSALPDSLLESELFGFRRGAFTGADRDRQGLFEQAHGGTLFLDEVGDTTPALQAKLLRAIEAQEIRPLGTTEVRRVDVRIVSATHHDLEAGVKEGTFRQDLYYRLNTVTIHLPPLRRRPVDVPFLAQHFAEEFGEAHARRIVLDESFITALSRQEFPGNVRELRNAVERAIALASPDEPVGAQHLQQTGSARASASLPPLGTLRARIEQLEIEAIREALEACGGNRTRAAEQLGLSRLGLRQKMRRLGLEKARSR